LGGNRGPGSCPDEGTDRSSSATADRATDDGTGCSAHDRAAKWVLRCGMFKGCADCERKQASEREFRHHVGSPKSQIFSHATLGPAVTEVKLQHEEDLASWPRVKSAIGFACSARLLIFHREHRLAELLQSTTGVAKPSCERYSWSSLS
jgi:hypothetical protein